MLNSSPISSQQSLGDLMVVLIQGHRGYKVILYGVLVDPSKSLTVFLQIGGLVSHITKDVLRTLSETMV